MSEVTIDAALLARLNGLTGPTTFRDENGRLLGQFVPAERLSFVPPPEDRCPSTVEELEEMLNATGGMKLADFWKKMGRQ
jgi:hypothetical protein